MQIKELWICSHGIKIQCYIEDPPKSDICIIVITSPFQHIHHIISAFSALYLTYKSWCFDWSNANLNCTVYLSQKCNSLSCFQLFTIISWALECIIFFIELWFYESFADSIETNFWNFQYGFTIVLLHKFFTRV